jgi:hypothetical protein
MPNNYQIFLDNSLSNYEDRLSEVERKIFDYNDGQWIEYFNDSWLRESFMAGRAENKTRKVLDLAATFLLLGQYQKSNVMTKEKYKKAVDKEIPASSAPPSVNNLLYGSIDIDEEDSGASCSAQLRADEDVDKNIYTTTRKEFDKREEREKKSKLRWRQTKTFKLNRLHSTPQIKSYRIKPVKGSDGKILKDINYNVVLMDVPHIIGGHIGLLPESNRFVAPSYTSKWCLVNTDNEFKFNGIWYKIDSSVKQYDVTGKATNAHSDFTNKSEMDKILVIEMEDKTLHFFDMNVEPLDLNLITPLNGE